VQPLLAVSWTRAGPGRSVAAAKWWTLLVVAPPTFMLLLDVCDAGHAGHVALDRAQHDASSAPKALRTRQIEAVAVPIVVCRNFPDVLGNVRDT
jgi:hypothetical protein